MLTITIISNAKNKYFENIDGNYHYNGQEVERTVSNVKPAMYDGTRVN